MASIRDIVRKLPNTSKGIVEYITNHPIKYSSIEDTLTTDPSTRQTLLECAQESVEKYAKYLGGFASGLSKAGHAVGYTADAWLLGTGDIVGSLGGKFLNLIAQVPEKLKSISYGIKTGNYLDSLQCILEGLVSYIPGLTFADQGLSRIVQKRMIKDTVKNFEKSVGTYKPWTAKLADKLKGLYKGVKDRKENVIDPKYAMSDKSGLEASLS
ncbi:MAG TPA: hypothetical protein PLX15_05545 [Candidatus Woesearchaeota archaeon]|jgi:hypothetical protein|nr:hypothetical protein [Candidatus Woesearchaeota archaeon]